MRPIRLVTDVLVELYEFIRFLPGQKAMGWESRIDFPLTGYGELPIDVFYGMRGSTSSMVRPSSILIIQYYVLFHHDAFPCVPFPPSHDLPV